MSAATTALEETAAPAMFADEIVYDEVYVPPQYEEIAINSEGDGLKLVKDSWQRLCCYFHCGRLVVVKADILLELKVRAVQAVSCQR